MHLALAVFATLAAVTLTLAAPQQNNNAAPGAAQLSASPAMRQLWMMMPAIDYACEMEETKTYNLPAPKDKMGCTKCKRDCHDKSPCVMQCYSNMAPDMFQTCMKTFTDPMCKPLVACYHNATNACDGANMGDVSGMPMDKMHMRDVSGDISGVLTNYIFLFQFFFG